MKSPKPKASLVVCLQPQGEEIDREENGCEIAEDKTDA